MALSMEKVSLGSFCWLTQTPMELASERISANAKVGVKSIFYSVSMPLQASMHCSL